MAGRILSMLLVLMICLGALPGTAFAAAYEDDGTGETVRFRMSVMKAGRSGAEDGGTGQADEAITTVTAPEPESRMKTVTIVKEFIGMKGNKIDADKVPSSFALEYSYTYGGKATDGKLLRSAATAGTNENGHPTLTWKLEVPVDKDMSSASKTPLTVTESGYEVDGYTWTKQSGLNSSDETAVSGTYRIDATGNLPTNYIRNYYTKNPLLELPKTGGTGIAPYIILGSTMALLAVLLLAGREKRR